MSTGGSDSGPDDRREADQELYRLSLAYASAVDARDGERLAELFVPDGALVVPRYPEDLRPTVTRAGYDALRSVPGGLRRYAYTLHQVANASFVVGPEGASGAVACVAHHVTSVAGGALDGAADIASAGDQGPPGQPGADLVWFIRYADGYRRTGQGWRFVRRVLHLLWVEEHPVVALCPPG